LGSISDADLFKYFLNDDIGSYTQAVPSASPPFCESPPMTPDAIFAEMDVPFVIKEEYPAPRSVSPLDSNPPRELKTSKGKGCESRKKVDTVPSQTSEEERQLKRQRRLVKNRESAQLSRMRKKIYIDDLEGKVSTLMTENAALKEEVLSLQHAIKQLTTGQNTPRVSTDAPSRITNSLTPHQRPTHPIRNTQAAGVCLLIVFFSLGLLFNATALSSNNGATNRPAAPDTRPRRETAHFSSILMDSSDHNMLDELITDNIMDSSTHISSSGRKRPVDELDDDGYNGNKHPRTEPVQYDISTNLDTQLDRRNTDEALDSNLPVNIVPGLDLEQPSIYRSLVNVHIWPILR
jgi:hypothetical protein